MDGRVVDAARDVAHRLAMSRELASRFHDACHAPPPARHATYVGPADRAPRSDGELAAPTRSNPHFAKWASLHAGNGPA